MASANNSITIEPPKCADLKCIGENAAKAWTDYVPLFISAIGMYKQYQMYEQMGDLAEAQKAMVEAQMAIYNSTFKDITKPSHERARDKLYGTYWNDLYRQVKQAIDCGLGSCEYDATEAGVEAAARAVADVAIVMRTARRTAKRSLSPSAVGACCDNDFRMASLQAQLTSDAVNSAIRYTDEKKFKWDQFFWQKMTGAATIIQNIGGLAANVHANAASNITSIINSGTAVLGAANQATESGFSALNAQAGLFGGIAGLGGAIFGNSVGGQMGQQLLNGFNPQQALNPQGFTAPNAITAQTPTFNWGNNFTGPPSHLNMMYDTVGMSTGTFGTGSGV